VNRAVLDTSVFVAVEQGRGLRRPLPDEVAVSVVTLAELETGVLAARDEETRAVRLRTLVAVRERVAALPADQRVASAYAGLAAAALRAGRRPRIHDTWIAATAITHASAVWTQDSDFGHYEGVEIVAV
jgi:predicted nucleic acid-binding protein